MLRNLFDFQVVFLLSFGLEVLLPPGNFFLPGAYGLMGLLRRTGCIHRKGLHIIEDQESGPFYLHGLTLFREGINNHMPSKDGMTLLIHSPIPMDVALKLGIDK